MEVEGEREGVCERRGRGKGYIGEIAGSATRSLFRNRIRLRHIHRPRLQRQ